MKTKDIVDSARRTLRDDFSTGEAHTDADFVDYINRSTKFIAHADTSSSITTGQIPLIAGGIQKLPDNGIRLVKIFHNDVAETVKARIGPRLYKGKHAIKNLPYNTLLSQLPNYAGGKRYPIATIFVFNKDDPKSFIVYPPNDGNGLVMATYSTIPLAITAIDADTDVPLPEIYFNILTNYVIALCLVRDSESPKNRERGMDFMQSVAAELGLKDAENTKDTPDDTVRE